MADVYDRWHKSRPAPGDPECPDHDGKVASREHGCGKRWQARWRDEAGAQRKENFDKKSDAERRATNVGADLSRGQYVDPRAGRVRFAAYAEGWLAAQTFDVSTRDRVERQLRLHILPELGKYELATMAARPSLIQAWLRGLQATIAPGYVKITLAVLSAVLSAAVDDELIRRNPCKLDSVKPPTVDKPRVQPWPAERVAAVREALPERYRVLVDEGAGLGLRQGEAFGLDVDDVDFLRGTVHVRRQVKLVGGVLFFAPPKGGRERDVPLGEAVGFRLARHVELFPPVTVTLPWKTPDGPPVTHRLVATSGQHKPLNRNYVNAFLWKPALVAAGVLARPAPARQLGFHGLRHTYASAMLAEGVDIRALAEFLGHHSAAFTLEVYCHLMPAAEDRARAAADRLFSPAGALAVPAWVVSDA